MRTPAGTECRFYYADYYRGRQKQECRLINQNPASERWTPGLCHGCPVPKILRANACPHLVLEARVGKALGGIIRRVEVSAACTKYLTDVPEPQAGCGHCHEVNPFAASPESSRP